MICQLRIPRLEDNSNLSVGLRVEISGVIYTARDAIIPKLCKLINDGQLADFPVSLLGSAIMHTAFSPAGFGPTSSNKEEIEGNMGILSKAGVRFHLGKGAIKQKTVNEISQYGSVFIVIPPVSALLQDRLISKRIIAFNEEGMEAFHELIVDRIPGIVAAAHGISIFQN